MIYEVTMTFAKPPQLSLKIAAQGVGQARQIAVEEAVHGGFGRPRRIYIQQKK